MTESRGAWLSPFRLAVAFTLARLALSGYWAVALPPFEAHDETGHYAYAYHVALTGTLPDPAAQLTAWFDESHQPPLYYLAAGILGRPLAPTDPYEPAVNPFFLRGDRLGGINAVAHDPATEAFPGTPAQRFLLVGRLLSAFLSAAAVLFVFVAVRLALPSPPWVPTVAAGLAASNPTWVFLGGAMNNDALVALTGTITLWACLRLWRKRRAALRDYALAGGTLGLALLSKNNALVLIPFAAAAVALAMRRADGASLAKLGAALTAFAAPAFALAGWWYARNFVVLGRPIGDRETTNIILREVAPFFETVGKRSPLEFVGTLVGNTFKTYWGQFGWGTIPLPDPVYLVLAVVTAVALLSLVRLRRESLPGLLALGLFVFLVGALPLYRAIFFNTPTLVPGRYLLPAIAGTSALLAAGLAGLPGRLGVFLSGGTVAGLFLLSAATPSLFVLPEYAQPQRLTVDQVGAAVTTTDYVYDGRARLVGYHADRDRVAPGDELRVTLYWAVLAPFDRDYTLALHLLDLQSQSRAATNSWPGNGNYPTSLWRPGEIFRDTYRLKIPESVSAPFVGFVRPKLHDYSPSSPGGADFQYRGDLPVTDSSGRSVEPNLGNVVVEAPMAQGDSRTGVARFSSAIELTAYSVERGGGPNDVQVQLAWRALEQPEDPLVVFVHVLDAAGRILAQSDSEPRGGLYPTTAWRAGEEIVDWHRLTLPRVLVPGEPIRLGIGLYRRADLQRVRATRTSGESLADNQLIIESSVS